MTSPTRLSPAHIRFLRKWLGFATADFAVVMVVRPETVSRWESKNSGYPIPPTAERLLRMMVANHQPVTQYPIELFKAEPRRNPEAMKFHAPDWKRAPRCHEVNDRHYHG